jgi:hypothetical protein
LKDRSSGLVVRYNWFEGQCNRQLDLVDAQDSTILTNDLNYGKAYVYGNVIVVDPLPGGNNDVVHFGGDTSGNGSGYRFGPLYFYNNTVVSHRTDKTRLLRLDSNNQSCDARNNIFYATPAAGSTLKLLDGFGIVTLVNNWFKTGWARFNVNKPKGTVMETGTITGTAPGFVNEAGLDFHLAAASQCVDTGSALNPDVLPTFNVVREYVKHLSSVARPVHGALDIGAYEF